MVRINFQEVSLLGEKRVPCAVCGKRLTRKTKVWQTENPYNRNVDGVPKSRQEIYAELQQEIRDWKLVSVVCRGCEAAQQEATGDE